MALSALCMRAHAAHSTNEAFDYRYTAELHYCNALAHLRKSIPVIDRVSADAVLACCMVLIPCGLALARVSQGSDSIPDWVHHLRGFRALGAAIDGCDTTQRSKQELIPYPQLGIPRKHIAGSQEDILPTEARLLWQAIRQSRQAAMDELRDAIAKSGHEHSPVDGEAYTAALNELEYVMDYITECRVSNYFRAVYTWPVQIPLGFLELLARKDELAFAIYAHWLVGTLLLDDLWWTRGFGVNGIGRVASILEESTSRYCHLLDWPKQMLQEWRSVCAGNDLSLGD